MPFPLKAFAAPTPLLGPEHPNTAADDIHVWPLQKGMKIAQRLKLKSKPLHIKLR